MKGPFRKWRQYLSIIWFFLYQACRMVESWYKCRFNTGISNRNDHFSLRYSLLNKKVSAWQRFDFTLTVGTTTLSNPSCVAFLRKKVLLVCGKLLWNSAKIHNVVSNLLAVTADARKRNGKKLCFIDLPQVQFFFSLEPPNLQPSISSTVQQCTNCHLFSVPEVRYYSPPFSSFFAKPLLSGSRPSLLSCMSVTVRIKMDGFKVVIGIVNHKLS